MADVKRREFITLLGARQWRGRWRRAQSKRTVPLCSAGPDVSGHLSELVHTRLGLRAIFSTPEGLIFGMGRFW